MCFLTWLFFILFCCVGVECEAGSGTAEVRWCHWLPPRARRGEDRNLSFFFFFWMFCLLFHYHILIFIYSFKHFFGLQIFCFQNCACFWHSCLYYFNFSKLTNQKIVQNLIYININIIFKFQQFKICYNYLCNINLFILFEMY